MSKQVYLYKDIRDKIIHAIDTLADPVVGTLSPRGANVIYEDSAGNQYVTNDGVTIAKNIVLKDPVENAIIEVIKHASLKTNNEAGDGTTTSILLSQNLIKSGLKLIDEGWNPIELKKEFDKFGKILIGKLSDDLYKIKNDKDLFNIATISSNNDPVIAKDIVRVIKIVGENGMVFIEPHNKQVTEIVEDVGFNIQGGLTHQELRNNKNTFSATYENVPALITDKRLYHAEEAEAILKVALAAGHKSLVIIARDFLGRSADFLVANHVKGIINLLLIKDPGCTDKDNDSTRDLATYLGGKMVTEKTGKIVNKITMDDFCMIGKIYSDPNKTIITPKKKVNPELTMLISALRKEAEKDKDDKAIKRRLSSLTNGMVTIKVGGSTQMETQERMFRYEDAVNATRAAVKDGYLVGGGIAMLNAFNPKDYNPDLVSVFKKFCEASVRQIAINCGKHTDTVVNTIRASKNKHFGYNALTDRFEDLLKSGVVDPYKVTEMAIQNSISVTGVIISSNYLIVNEVEEKDK